MRRCPCLSLVDRGAALLAPTEINRNHYRIVRLAARYDNELDWYHQGFSTAVLAIAQTEDELLEIANERSATVHTCLVPIRPLTPNPPHPMRPRTHFSHVQ